MSAKRTIFHSHSRKAFPEEAPVLDAAQRAAVEIAHKYGKAEGAALFQGVAHVSAIPTVHSAVELMRRDSHADAIGAQVRAAGLSKPSKSSAIEDANNEAVRLLRTFGLAT